MSQITQFFTNNVPGGYVQTLTGNTGGAVGPAGGNINVVGDGSTITVAGNPGSNTLTISATGLVSTSFPTDSGTATPSADVLNVFGGVSGRNINTTGSGNTIHVNMNNAITLGDLSSIIGSAALTCTTGDVTLSAGNINLPNTSNSGDEGVITLGGNRFAYYRGGTFIGPLSGNFTNSGIANIGLGAATLTNLTSGRDNVALGGAALQSLQDGIENVAVGLFSSDAMTSASFNVAVGYESLTALTTGDFNIAIGDSAGQNYTSSESSNIVIAHEGVIGDSNTIRIGTTGSGLSEQDKCYIGATYGVNVGSVATVVTMASSEQIGTAAITAGTGIVVTPSANAITISASGTTSLTYTNVNTSPYVVLSTDEYLSVDCSGGPITLQFPNAATASRAYIVKDRTGSAATNNITVTTVGGAVNIDGATTFVMNTAYQSIQIIGNATTYEVF